MTWLRRFGAGLVALLCRRRVENDLDAELAAFLEEAVAQQRAAGLSQAAASRAARLELGSPEAVKDRVREVGWESLAAACWQDLRYAVRTLRTSRAFATAAVCTLALGVGAVTIIFSVLYAVLLEPFPYKDINRSVVFSLRGLTNVGGWRGRSWLSGPEFLVFREQNRVFEDLIGSRDATVLCDDGRSTRLLRGSYVTANTFDYLGIPPLIGRTFAADDDRSGGPATFVMSHRTWQREFDADPKLLGTTMRLNGDPYLLVGIMPERFHVYGADVWMAAGREGHLGGTLEPLGRLKRGITVEAASADLNRIAHQLAAEHRLANAPEQFTVAVQTFLDSRLGSFTRTLYGLLAAVLVLLLIACGNVANLLLARATVREREMAMRASLGATQGRLIRQLLVESIVLAVAAAAAGWLLAATGLRFVVAALPTGTIPTETVIRLNVAVLAGSLGLAVLTMLIGSLAPALHLVRGDLQSRLTGSGRGSGGSVHHGGLRSCLVVLEVALSTVLLTAAGLLMREFVKLTHVDLGFNPSNVLYVRPWFPREYDAARKNAFTRELLQRLQALPGVVSVAESMLLPPLTHDWSDTIIPGRPHAERWETRFELCSEGYFRTLGFQLREGALFSEADVTAKRLVTVVNQAFVRQYFPDEDPLGKRVKFQVLDRPFLDAPHDAYFEIIGVVSNHKTWGGTWQVVPQAFLPYSVQGFSWRTFLARTSVDPATGLKSAREAVWATDRRVGVRDSGSIESSLSDFYHRPQFELLMLGTFASLGLVLVSIGIFSVMAYAVSRQTHEVGVRVALGARHGQILSMMLRKGLRLVVAGGVIGLAVSLIFSRVLTSQLEGTMQRGNVSRADPAAFMTVAGIVLAVGLVACFLPAYHATRVDPLVALRHE